jgi:hypothetical protein
MTFGPRVLQRHVHLSEKAEIVWDLVGDFRRIDSWYPGIVNIAVIAKDGETSRLITSSDGSTYDEVLLSDDPQRMRHIYWLRRGDIQVSSYVAYIEVSDAGPTSCFFAWTVCFTYGDFRTLALDEVLEVIEAGISVLEKKFGKFGDDLSGGEKL